MTTLSVTSSGTRSIGAPEEKTTWAASGSHLMLCSPGPQPLSDMSTRPPMIMRCFREEANRGSRMIAVATLVSGPTARTVISPGFAITVSIR